MKIKKINKTIANYKTFKQGFTLIEIMLWIVIVTTVLIWWFQALSAITVWKAKLIQKVDIQKESFYFTEKLFEMIKKWGTLDYEEYFNRKVIWNSTYSSWHFSVPSWFGNYWNWWTVLNVWPPVFWDYHYFCASWNLSQMWIDWCYNNIFNTYGSIVTWSQQRYGQYSYQYVDYNSNFDDDLWDENVDWNIIWDDDDEYVWDWPEVFWSGVSLPELYLRSWNKLERTLFRWSVKLDPNAPSTAPCNIDSTTNVLTWSWCIWTVEYIKLLWKDMWKNHDNAWSTYLDWLIDTWVVDPEFTWWDVVIAWSRNVERLPLFSDYIDVSEFSFTSFPNKDIALAWKNTDKSVNLSPYTILKLKLKPSWLTKKKIWWNWEELDFSMTINLSEIYSY